MVRHAPATLLPAMNVYRVDVASDESGADDPADCPEAVGTVSATFFDASFCHNGLRRILRVDDEAVIAAVEELVPLWQAIVVLVNSPIFGGSGGEVVVAAVNANWTDTMLHELGHGLFGLADEYSTSGGDDEPDTCIDQAPGAEPCQPNVMAARMRAALKWAYLTDPETPVPTMENPDCSVSDPRPNVLADDHELGLFEGARYAHCGLFRPAYVCKMRVKEEDFCRVCVAAIHERLRPFFPEQPFLATETTVLDFGGVAIGLSRILAFEVSNVGSVDVTGVEIAIDNPNYSFVLSSDVDVLAPGDRLGIAVTLSPMFLEGSQNGTLRITSDAPTLEVSLRATICVGAPLADAVSVDGANTLDFGSVAEGLTMYRAFEVRNLRGPCPAELPVSITIAPDPGAFRLARPADASFTLPAPEIGEDMTSRQIFVAYTAPAGAGPEQSGTATVDTPADPFHGFESLTLLARPVALDPVDTVVIIDRSGSMSEPTGESGQAKIDHAIYAAQLFVSLLRDQDRVGIVRYNAAAAEASGDLLMPLTQAGPEDGGAGREAASNALTLSNLTPSGNTSIGAGLILGSQVLESGASDRRALVVLTDGRQNRDPTVADAQAIVEQADPAQRVFAVGLGLNQLEATLHEITAATEGTAQITGELVGNKEFLLQKLYVQILSDVADEAFVKDPHAVVLPGHERQTRIDVGEVDLGLDVIVVLRPTRYHPQYTRIWLEAPDGTIVTTDDLIAGAFPNARLVTGESHVVFRWLFPAFPDRPQAHLGRWRVWVRNLAGSTQTRNPSARTLRCSVMAKARSNLLLGGRLVQSGYAPGTPMTLILEAASNGKPAALDPPVYGRVHRPDGRVARLVLEPTELGQYVGHLTDTWLTGAYRVDAAVRVTTRRGHRVSRYRHFTGLIWESKRGSRGRGAGRSRR